MGFSRPSSVGPQEVCAYCVVLLVLDPPTWIGFFAAAGGATRSYDLPPHVVPHPRLFPAAQVAMYLSPRPTTLLFPTTIWSINTADAP